MKKDVYQMITDRIIEKLENGVIPWKKPWNGADSAFNRISKKSYSILNQMALDKRGEYATFKQWTDLGGKVKKGEKSELIVFWKLLPIEEEQDDGSILKKNIPFLKYSNVFHISQIDGVESLKKEDVADVEPFEPLEEAENLLDAYWKREHITVKHIKDSRAFYKPSEDKIYLPLFEQFKTVQGYYATAFHESVHSTLKANRCNREIDLKGSLSFGSNEYSKEELVAEIGSSYLMNILGIENEDTEKNTAAYIQGWLKVLRNDNKFIVSASSKAEKAVKYILNEE